MIVGLGGIGAIAPAATAATPPSPIGSFDAVAARFDNNRYVSGWAADADALGQPITVRLYLGGTFVAQVPTTDPRPDVAARVQGVGQNTGWHATITPKQIWNAASGTVMCAYAINVGAGANASLGCKDLGVPTGPSSHNPRGNLERVTTQPGLVRLRGWAGDPDSNGPTRLRIYYDGNPVGSAVTKLPRPDVAALGLGTTTGFDTTLPIASLGIYGPPRTTPLGYVHVCVYVENAGALGTDNGTVGCAQPAEPGVRPPGPHDPVGSVDQADGNGGEHGWAYDPDSSGPVTVIVRRFDVGGSGSFYGKLPTGEARPDVFAAHPEAGPNSGYRGELRYIPEAGVETPSSQVSAQVTFTSVYWFACGYAQNVGPGANRFLGCRLDGGYIKTG